MKIGTLVIFLLWGLTLELSAQVDFSQTRWDLGEIPPSRILRQEITLVNQSEGDIHFLLTPDCSCLTVEPSEFILSPESEQSVALSYDSTGQLGEQRKYLIIRSDNPDLSKALFPITAMVQGGDLQASLDSSWMGNGGTEVGDESNPLELLHADSTYEGEVLILDYYYSPGCRSCEAFLNREIPRIQRELNRGITLRTWNVLEGPVLSMLEQRAQEQNTPWTELPVLTGEFFFLQGDRQIEHLLVQALAHEIDGNPFRGDISISRGFSLSLLPVFLAGLLDGVNPCAFTTMIFLISALTVFGRGRREILLIGLSFTFSVFATYYAVGFGMFTALRLFSGFHMISLIIAWLLFAGLLVLSLFSFRDAWLCRKGRAREMTLQLPELIKKRMKASIKEYARSSALVGGALILGITVSLFELACTGQVYLPILAWMTQQKEQPLAWAWLLLYNVGFILPLAAVFVAAWLGIKSQRIIELYQKRMAPVKLALGAFFLIMAGLLILGMGLK